MSFRRKPESRPNVESIVRLDTGLRRYDASKKVIIMFSVRKASCCCQPPPVGALPMALL